MHTGIRISGVQANNTPNNYPKRIENAIGLLYAEVRDTFSNILKQLELNKTNPGEIILRIIQGTKSTRIGPQFSEKGRSLLLERIKRTIDAGRPIHLQTFSSARKYKAKTPKTSGPDTAELSAAILMDSIHWAITRVYEHGAMFTVIADDLTGKTLFPGKEGMISANVPRLKNLMEMVSPRIKVLCESSLFLEKGISGIEHARLIEELTKLFLTYILDSERIEDENKPHIASLQNLRNIGWAGIIPSAMREFYRKKIRQTHHTIPEIEVQEWLARFFATTMLKVMHGIGNNKENEISPIRFSFAGPPPGSIYTGERAHFQTIPDASTSAPFWIIDGGIKFAGGDGCGSFIDAFGTESANHDIINQVHLESDSGQGILYEVKII